MTTTHRYAAAVAAGAALLCLSTSAPAQSTPPASAVAPVASAPVSPAKHALALKVVSLQQAAVEGIARNLAENSVTRLAQAAGAAMQQVPADKRDAIAKSLDTDIRKYLDETTPMLRDAAVKLSATTLPPLLEDKFSEDELKQLAQWLDSPINRKYQQVAPAMQTALLQKLVADTRAQVEPKLKALEGRMSATLGDPNAAPAASGPAGSGMKPAPAAKLGAPAKPASSGKSQP